MLWKIAGKKKYQKSAVNYHNNRKDTIIITNKKLILHNSKRFKVISRMLESLAGCRTLFLFAVSCKIGALERKAY